jgi:peptide/nickel transport system ATP-binding protein
MNVHGLYANERERKDKVLQLAQSREHGWIRSTTVIRMNSAAGSVNVSVLRVLSALNPRFIICDESVSALDVSVPAQVL